MPRLKVKVISGAIALALSLPSFGAEQAWVAKSNENSKLLLAVMAKYAPEDASSLGVDGFDEKIDQYLAGTPGLEPRGDGTARVPRAVTPDPTAKQERAETEVDTAPTVALPAVDSAPVVVARVDAEAAQVFLDVERGAAG
mgnify:CR=1 FL=1